MRVGLVGLGNMGKGIGKNILMSQNVQSLSALEIFEPNRLEFVDSIPETIKSRLRMCNNVGSVAEESSIIALSLPSEEATLSVLFGDEGIVNWSKGTSKKDLIVCDHGTFSREFILHNHNKLKDAGIMYVDAPVSGGPGGASAGTLTIMSGGPVSTISNCKPLWELYSSNIFHFGDVGSGMAAKLINQALVGVHALAACEALHLAETMGIEDVKTLQAMLRTSWGQSKILDLTMTDYLTSKEQGWDVLSKSAAPLRNMKKDFKCILNGTQPALPLTESTGSMINLACDKERYGLEDTAFVGLIKLLRK